MTLTDLQLLALLILETEQGHVLTGGYRDVLASVATDVAWCGFRGFQLARVGRLWENVYGVSFSTLCPDLRDHASDWTGV